MKKKAIALMLASLILFVMGYLVLCFYNNTFNITLMDNLSKGIFIFCWLFLSLMLLPVIDELDKNNSK